MKYLRPVLMSRHEDRLKKDKDFQYLLEDIADLKGQIKKNQVSLNEAERRKERDVREAKLEARKDVVERASEAVAGQQSATEKNRMRRDDGLQADERDVANDLALKKARESAKDVLLNEAVHILSDGAGVATTGPRLTARNKPAAVSTTN